MSKEEQIINLLEFYYRWNGYRTFSFHISNDHLSELSREYILEFARERNLKVEFNIKVTSFYGSRSEQVDVLNKLQQEKYNLINFLKNKINKYSHEHIVADLYTQYDLNYAIKSAYQDILERVISGEYE